MPAETRRAAPTPPPTTDSVIETTVVPQKELESRRQQAERARRHASAIGDYAAAESWYREARALDEQLDAQAPSEPHA